MDENIKLGQILCMPYGRILRICNVKK